MTKLLFSPFIFLYKKLSWILNSLDTKTDGASARKLSAFFAIVVVSGYITFKYTDSRNVITLVIVWLVFASLCLGMVTAQQVIELKNGDKSKTTDTTITNNPTQNGSTTP